MASKKSLSSQGAVKKKLPKSSEFHQMKFLRAENSNAADSQKLLLKQTDDNVLKQSDSSTAVTAQSLLPHEVAPKQTQASVNMAPVDSNVNKQLNRSSSKMDTAFLIWTEIPHELKKSHVTFTEYSNLMAKNQLSADSETIGNNDSHSLLSVGQPLYDDIIHRKEEWERYAEDSRGQFNLSMEENQHRRASPSQNLPPPRVYLHEQDKAMLSKQEPLYNEVLETCSTKIDANYEVVPFDPRVVKDQEGNNGGDMNESLILQKKPVTTNVLSPERIDTERRSHLEYKDTGEPFISQYSDQGQIVVHQPYPGVVEDWKSNACLPRAYLPPVKETVWEGPYDDSVFPTKHRLGTSEDMRAAMMQARKPTYYRRENYARREVGIDGGLALNKNSRPNYSRFTHTTRSDLHLKYRQVMAEVHRRSFNDWKSEISVTAGQEQEPNEETKTVTNAFLEKFGYLDCPRCHQRVTGLYGKPCSCQKLKHYLDTNPCYTKNQKPKRSWNPRNEIRRSSLAVNRQVAGSVLVPSPLLKSTEGHQSPHPNCTRENEAERSAMNMELLGDTTAEFNSDKPYQDTGSNNTVKAIPATQASGEPDKSVEQAGDARRSARTFHPRKSASSDKRSRTLLGDFEVLNSPDRTSRPLREWEINTLEFTLKKCLSDKRGILRSPNLSL